MRHSLRSWSAAGTAAFVLAAATAVVAQPTTNPGNPSPAPGAQPNTTPPATQGSAMPGGSSMNGPSMGGGAMSGSKGSPTTVTLGAQNGSGETGTATLMQSPNGLVVSLTLHPAPDAPQPAHIHKGSCAKLDPVPAYPLTNVTKGTDSQGNPAGVSTTTLTKVTLADLLKGQFAINVHKSATDIKTYVACGDIKGGG